MNCTSLYIFPPAMLSCCSTFHFILKVMKGRLEILALWKLEYVHQNYGRTVLSSILEFAIFRLHLPFGVCSPV